MKLIFILIPLFLLSVGCQHTATTNNNQKSANFESSTKEYRVPANRFTKIARKSAALTDLHFCILIASDVKVSNGVDGLVWENMGCNESFQKARDSGATDQEVKDQAIDSLRKATISHLEQCAKERITNSQHSCEKLINRAKKLGLTRGDIDKELGIVKHFID